MMQQNERGAEHVDTTKLVEVNNSVNIIPCKGAEMERGIFSRKVQASQKC